MPSAEDLERPRVFCCVNSMASELLSLHPLLSIQQVMFAVNRASIGSNTWALNIFARCVSFRQFSHMAAWHVVQMTCASACY